MQAAAKESTVFPKYLQMILFCCGISLGTATLSRAADATGSVQRPEKPPGDAPRVSVPVIDLLNAKLNGKEIFGLSPESITDLLGKPSSTKAPQEILPRKIGSHVLPGAKFGAQVMYIDKGLYFAFEHPDLDIHQSCAAALVYISDTTEAYGGSHYKAYDGELAKGVDGSWKARRVMEEFSELNPKDMMEDEKSRAEIEQAKQLAKRAADASRRFELSETEAKALSGAASLVTDKIEAASLIVIERHGFKIEFLYEPNTKFIQKVRLYRAAKD